MDRSPGTKLPDKLQTTAGCVCNTDSTAGLDLGSRSVQESGDFFSFCTRVDERERQTKMGGMLRVCGSTNGGRWEDAILLVLWKAAW